VHFVDDAQVTRVLSFPVLIDAMEKAHRQQKIEVLDGYLGTEREQYVVRSASAPGRYMATKMFTSFPANLTTGKLPAVQAVCVLFDGSDVVRWR
jgi:ornithine cyclodeaminase